MHAAHTATISFAYETPESARAVERSVRPEVGAIDDDRSRAEVDREGATVEVRVEAADLVALRASTNTWTRLVETAESISGLVDPPDASGAN